MKQSIHPLIVVCIIVGAIVLVGVPVFAISRFIANQKAIQSGQDIDVWLVNSFEDCAKAGYPVMESYPRQCRTNDKTFVEEVSQPVPPQEDKPIVVPPAGGGAVRDNCRPTGCSGEICADEEMVSTCIYKPEFACYKTATCERQQNGKCGWTETDALKSCIEAARQGGGSTEVYY